MNRALACGIASGVCLAAGITGFGAARYAESVCTAVNASGQRVVIGTELNAAGQRYKRDNPADDNNAIVEALGGRGPETAWTRESIARCRVMLGVSGVVWAPSFALSLLFGGFAVALTGRQRTARRREGRVVFLSYNHEDAATAARLHEAMKAQGITVLIDSESMTPGERIEDFIARSIQQADVVVSLVSSHSLFSAWVAAETIRSIQRGRSEEGGKLLACYLDDAFFEPEYRLQMTEKIDERIRRIEQLIPDYAARRIDTLDLNEEKTRLYDLRNNLGPILAALKDCLCLDVREERFEDSSRRLVAAIRVERR